MEFSKLLIFVAAALFVFFARQSDASSQSIEKVYTNLKQHRAYNETKLKLQKQASKENNDEVHRIIFNGTLDAVENIKLSSDSVYDGLKKANSMNASSEVKIQNFTESFDSSYKLIVNAGIKIYSALGAATQISEDKARQRLTEAIKISTDAGATAADGFDAVKKLTIAGIKAGIVGEHQATLAGLRSAQITEEAAYNLLLKTAERANAAVNNNSLPLKEAKDPVAKGSSVCQYAIDSIEKSAKKSSSQATSEAEKQAIEVVSHGLMDTCKTISAAAQSGGEAIEAAKNIPNRESALAAVRRGILNLQKGFLAACAKAQQTLGAAFYIVGQTIKESSIEAMTTVEGGRVLLLEGSQNTYVIVSQGIKNNASENVFIAAHDDVATTAISGCAVILKSAKILFKAIVSEQT